MTFGDLRAYYEAYDEAGRLDTGVFQLERRAVKDAFWRPMRRRSGRLVRIADLGLSGPVPPGPGDSEPPPPYHAAILLMSRGSAEGTRAVPESVAIPGVLLRFLERASIAYAGTRDHDRVPHLHWVCGWAAQPEPGRLAFIVSRPFTERLLQDVEVCPRIALTIEDIGPHETYQFKGAFAGTRPVGLAERAAFESCRERFIRSVQGIETRYDFSREDLARYLGEPERAVVMRVQEIFLQTPGPGAGRRLVPPEEQ